MLIKKTIKYEKVPTPQNIHLEITVAKIDTAEGPINLYAAYFPPNSCVDHDEINHLLHPTRPTLIAGYPNAKHTD